MNKKCIQQTLPCLKSCSGQEPDYDCLLKPAGQLGLIPEWKETTKYQITEVPEPTHYLDLTPPKDLGKEARHFTKLYEHNKKDIKVLFWNEPYCEIEVRTGDKIVLHEDCHITWIKQKPSEPNREELQIRLDAVKAFVNERAIPLTHTRIILELIAGQKVTKP
jgi:hypothetical protein